MVSRLLTYGFFFIVVPFSTWPLQAQSDLDHRLFLLANTVDLDDPATRYISYLQSLLKSETTPYSLVINGDLTSDTKFDTLMLNHLLNATTSEKGKIFIIPGDRDWRNSGMEGYSQVLALQQTVEDWNISGVTWAINDGCPGPKEFMIDKNTLLITINTQWFNHPYRKPEPADGTCKIITEADFLEELEDIIEDNQDLNILIAGHFPILSIGKSGGRFPVSDYFLPVPIVSGMITSFHQNVGDAYDLSNDRFVPIRSKISNLLQGYSSLIYLSGHDKNQQILSREDNVYINSGALLNGEYVAKDKSALLVSSDPGVIEVRFYSSGQIDARFHHFSSDGFIQYQDILLFQSSCESEIYNRPQNHGFVPCREEIDVGLKMSGTYPNNIESIAGSGYGLSKFGRFWLGNHYRDTWTKSITTKYLDLDTTFSGLIPFEKGGARQTKSLKFNAGNGGEFVFRSVDKDPSKALPFELRETVVAEILRDQTTTQHPYGALAVDVMLNHTNILHAHPTLYVMPDDGKLGSYQKEFGNMLGMLEDRPTNPEKVEVSFADADIILKSYKLFRDLYDDHDNEVLKEEFVRARVFDMLVGDWGKHEDNWKWAGYKTDDGVIYRPIPRDRDHVFSKWDGVLPWLADREWAKPSGENFGYTIKGLRSLMWQARHLDRFLANEVTLEGWIEAANYIQTHISNQAIEEAIRAMPVEMYNISGKEIENKLKSRRRDLESYALRYYSILAKQVDVVGSNKCEYFDVKRNADGTVEVWMWDMEDGEKDENELFYYRKFFPDETREIRLFGLGDEDVMNIEGGCENSIKVRVIGGPGADKIRDVSNVRGWIKNTLIYEKDSLAEITIGREGKIVDIPNTNAYHYDRTAFAYNTYLPTPYIAYNVDNGFLLNLGVQFTRQRYGKPEYSTKHDLQAAVSTQGNVSFEYELRLRHALRNWDLLAGGGIGVPAHFNFFFGLGNETVKVDSLFDQDFYRTNYDSYFARLELIRELWKRSYFSIGLEYQNNEANIQPGRILDDQELGKVFGRNPVNLIQGMVALNFDFKDNPHIPKRGMHFYLEHKNGFVTSEYNNNFGQTELFLEQYVSNHWDNPITLGLKVGGSHNYGPVPFYNLRYLGQRNNLRGYLRNRFTGDWTAYLNSNLGIQVAEANTSIVPFRFGIHGFFDIGRVWLDGENSARWHKGYGAGFYVVPLKEQFVIYLALGFSEEESALILFNLGRFF